MSTRSAFPKGRLASVLTNRSTPRARLVMAVAVAASVGTPGAKGQPDGFDYVKRATRAETRAATLAQYMPYLELGPWWIAGPFDNAGRDKHDVVYAPELGVDLEAEMTGRNGRAVRWERFDDTAWTKIDLNRFGGPEDNTDAIAYLHRTFTADKAAKVAFDMGSDDGLKVWLNGRLVVDADVYRGFDIDAHRVELALEAGENTVLVKVTQGAGGWEFQMKPRLDPKIGALLKYHLDRDFPVSREFEHYAPLTVFEPDGVVLEVGGLAVLPDGRPVVATRRGEVWIVEGAYDDPPFDAVYKRFAFGLHEPLGLMWDEEHGGLLTVQRGEVTRLVDTDGDDVADVYETVARIPISGNYHEFGFGPVRDGDGRLWIALNVGFCGALGKSVVPYRGWALAVNDDGTLEPMCGGLRSPNTLGRNAAGDIFACDNQGDWVGTCKLMHLDKGDWHGHPGGNRWYEDAGMAEPTEADWKPPAVWFPYDRMGRSASDILVDETGGRFGPFEGQLFVGDQYSAEIMRVHLEQVDGVYQGACFPFVSGLDCGVNRMAWAPDGSMLVGETNRGWWSKGTRPWGLQRLTYTGKLPFEIKEMRALRDGFELVFTKPVEPSLAADPEAYALASFTYHRWETYGSPEIDREEHAVRLAEVSPDGLRVRLKLDRVRVGHVHELVVEGIRSADGEPLLHEMAFYTLNRVPG